MTDANVDIVIVIVIDCHDVQSPFDTWVALGYRNLGSRIR